jgi:hypothetical protein
MKTSLGSWMLLSLASMSQVTSAPESDVKYGVATRDYSIEMKITFLDPYVGQRLAFSSGVDSGKELCFSAGDGRTGPCIERFVGAVAVVRYSVKLANGGTPSLASIGACDGLCPIFRSPAAGAVFDNAKAGEGIGSDLQVFGYDEGPLKKADRIRTRRQAQTMWWRLCRQELCIGKETKPFAIVEWKHTLNRSSIIQIYAPPDRE